MPEFGKGDKGGSEASHHVRTSGVKNDGTACCCVVDSGFSVTHIVPTVKSNAIVSIFHSLKSLSLFFLLS